MTQDDWLAILAQITPSGPDDPDGDLFGAAPATAGPGLPEWRGGAAPGLTPSRHLWARAEGAAAGLGVRVLTALPDCAPAALRLAAAAAERGVMPVILSAVADSGFERFGFRVERVFGESAAEREAAEAEIAAFWTLAIIIDAADIAALG